MNAILFMVIDIGYTINILHDLAFLLLHYADVECFRSL